LELIGDTTESMTIIGSFRFPCFKDCACFNVLVYF
jgi:hypothetical protein